jgi:hypothetical protein
MFSEQTGRWLDAEVAKSAGGDPFSASAPDPAETVWAEDAAVRLRRAAGVVRSHVTSGRPFSPEVGRRLAAWFESAAEEACLVGPDPSAVAVADALLAVEPKCGDRDGCR